MNITRRQTLIGTAGMALTSLLPFSKAQALTDMDKIILDKVDRFIGRNNNPEVYNESEVYTLEVHRELFKRMSLKRIRGIEITILEEEPDKHGYVTYCRITAKAAKGREWYRGHCDLYPLEKLNSWIKEKKGKGISTERFHIA